MQPIGPTFIGHSSIHNMYIPTTKIQYHTGREFLLGLKVSIFSPMKNSLNSNLKFENQKSKFAAMTFTTEPRGFIKICVHFHSVG